MSTRSARSRGRGDNRPVYLQIAEFLRDQLGRPSTDAGRLPTEAELVETFKVSRQTARRAYAELVARGLVTRAPGKGTFPARSERFLMSVGSVDDLLSQSQEREQHVLRPLSVIRNSDAATKLGLPGDDVGCVAYTLTHGGAAFAVSYIYLPPFVARLLDDVASLHKPGAVTKETVIAMLDRRLPHPIGQAKQLVVAVAAPTEIASTIGVEPGVPILRNEFLYFDTDARPVELSINFYHPELYEFRALLQRRPHDPVLWNEVPA